MNFKNAVFFGLLQTSLVMASESMPPAPCEKGHGTGYIESYAKVDERHSCPQWRFTCVVDDDRCPKPTPHSPDFCPDGQIMSVPHYLPLEGRFSCSLPEFACVRHHLCPQYSPLPPDFCPDGVVSGGVTGFFQVQGRYSCPKYTAVCEKADLCPM